MADTSPAPLNGAYYGPSIPPHPQYHPRRRPSPLGCLLCTLLKVVVPIVIILGIAVFVLWLVFRPHDLKVHVEEARLFQFNLTDGNTLHYRLDLNVSVRNPNKKLGFYYDLVEAVAIYDDERFAFAPLPTFYQGHKNTTILRPAFASQAVLVGSVPETYAREKADGFYNIEVKFYTRVRIKAGRFKSRHIKPKFDCDLRLPAPTPAGNGSAPTPVFQRTKCDVDF